MSLMNGVVIGLVTDINGKGMVKVRFPWLPDEPETDWIRIATTMAGNDRGTFFMPEKEDEVLVAFEHGDTNYPYVVGFLWNGKDKPPERDKNIRKIKTKSGHIIEFNDNPGQEKIKIKSQGEHEVILDDKDQKITISSKLGQEIVINDQATKINITSRLGQEIIIDDLAMKVTIKAPVQLEVKTLLAKFSGIIEAKMVRTEVVQSKIYSPGVGNIH